jgi:chaperone modulatory protein CbpM
MNVEHENLLVGILLDDKVCVSLRELSSMCGVNAEMIVEMVGEGIAEPEGSSPQQWRFTGTAVRRFQTALRLQRDLKVNLAGAALALDLLEELAELRRFRNQWLTR